MFATCRTDGCGNAGHPIDLTAALAGLDDPPSVIVCGACGVPITDLATSS